MVVSVDSLVPGRDPCPLVAAATLPTPSTMAKLAAAVTIVPRVPCMIRLLGSPERYPEVSARRPGESTVVRVNPDSSPFSTNNATGNRPATRTIPADSVAGGGERGLVAPLVFKTSGTGAPRPVGSIPAASANAFFRNCPGPSQLTNIAKNRQNPVAGIAQPDAASGVTGVKVPGLSRPRTKTSLPASIRYKPELADLARAATT